MWNVYPSGTQSKQELPYYGQQKLNPLLLKYCSRASAVQGGETFNVNINSVPYYSSQLQTDMRFFRELNKCHGNMFVNKGTYQLWNQCRQLDNGDATLTDNAPSVQPGFTDLDDNTAPTQKYELRDVKSAIVKDGWNGISQHHLRGMNKVNGVSFLSIIHSDAANALRAQRLMVMRVKDVGKIPHSRKTTYGQTEWKAQANK